MMALSESYASEALAGFSKGAVYDRHRPSYPPQAVDDLLQALRLDVSGGSPANVLDLGAGTGKFTELLARRPNRFEIVAVEPNAGMRQELEKKRLPNVTVVDGLASRIPAQDESFDAVIAAQAFHWFANLSALKEIHRVLLPTGSLGLIWNIEDYNQTKTYSCTTEWEGQLRDLIWTFEDSRLRYRNEKWRQIFHEQTKSTPIFTTKTTDPLFSLPLGEKQIPFTVRMSRDDLWKRWCTLSQIAVLESEALQKHKAEFDRVVSQADTEEDGEELVAVHGITVLAWTSKIPEVPL